MSTQNGFDLGKQEQSAQEVESKGQWVEVLDLNDEPMTYEKPNTEGPPSVYPVRVLVAGTYSTQYKQTFDRQRQKMIQKRRGKLTSQQLTEQQRELAAACCLQWEGFFLNELPFPCSPANAEKLFGVAPHIQEQVEQAMTDHSSFFKSASSS